MPSTTLTAQRLRGTALTILISSVFGALWGLSGSTALIGGWTWIAAILVGTVTLALLIMAYTFSRNASQLPDGSSDQTTNPFRTRAYSIAVAAEIIAIPIASRLLSANGHSDAIMSVIAIIVGLHFFGLVPAFRSWSFAWVGAAFCVLALAALAMPALVTLNGAAPGFALRNAVVGFGCALILWISIIPIIVATRRQLAARADAEA